MKSIWQMTDKEVKELPKDVKEKLQLDYINYPVQSEGDFELKQNALKRLGYPYWYYKKYTEGENIEVKKVEGK